MDHRDQAGNGILIAIFSLFLLGAAGGVYYYFSGGQASETDKFAQAARSAYHDAIARLEKAMSDNKSFDASLDHNASSFECLYSGDGSCKGQGGAFLLFENSQNLRPLSQLARDAGVDPYGNPCRGFPSKECPLRVETDWEPVCNGVHCESTRSARVKGVVTLAPIYSGETQQQWTKEAMFTPQIQLSAASQCERDGRIWTGSECLTSSQVADRRMPANSRQDVPPQQPSDAQQQPAAEQAPPAQPPQPVPQQQVECPAQIVVQGQFYPVQYISADRAQVAVPAMSCPVQGAVDVFVFQCTAKNPPTFPGEGQWIQVEAVMAPPCDSNGNPAGNQPVRF